MFIYKPLTMILMLVIFTLSNSCSTETPETKNMVVMPEVNEENCLIENIEKIKDKEIKQSFATKCFYR